MIKSIIVLSGMVVVLLSCSHARLYTYDVRQQILTDSLRVADSVRMADSMRVADSLAVVRYESSDQENQERAREAALEKARADSARKAVVPIAPSEGDIFSARKIVIPQGHECAKAIDSVQRVIDSLQAVLYPKDDKFGKMADFTFEDKKRYFDFLIRNHYKDSAQILTWCETMQSMLNIEQEKMRLLIKTQKDENTKSFLMAHLKKTQIKLVDLGNVIVGMTPKVPSGVVHQKPQQLQE